MTSNNVLGTTQIGLIILVLAATGLDLLGYDVHFFTVGAYRVGLLIDTPLIKIRQAVEKKWTDRVQFRAADIVTRDLASSWLLVSNVPPRCKTRLANWLEENKESVGTSYASELARHYR